MRVSSLLFAVGLAVSVGLFAFAGCSSESGSGTTTTTTSAASTSGSSGSTGSTSGSTGSGGGSSSSTSGGGGSEGYQTCGECTSGSETKECGTEKAACDKIADCVNIYNCVYGLDGSAGCTTDHDGGCCTLGCFTSTAASQAGITAYKAFDSCVYCTTCKTLCTMPPSYDATEYCKAVSGTSACP
jgi:hypothetical protein